MYDNTERPNLDEQYIAATTSSDLTLDPDHIGAVDHLIASGLSGNRMGTVLIHLTAEWGRAAKPPKWTEAEVHERAGKLPKRAGKLDIRRARAEAIVAYATALRAAYRRLQGRPVALAIMGEWAQLRGVDSDLLSPSLYHYLHPTCPVCDGHGHVKMPDAPVLGKQCQHCRGEGTWPRPAGSHRVGEWLKSCASRAKSQRAGLLRGKHEITPMAERLRRAD